jgi:acyl-CoA dehydrogenase
MVDFKLTDEQKQYQQLARDFAQKEIAPIAERHDHTGEFATAVYAQAWEMGLINLLVPDNQGGLGLSVMDACLIMEEIGAACTGIGAAIEANNLATQPLILFGTDEQRSQYLSPMMDEMRFAAYSVQESAPGMQGIRTTVHPDGDRFVINGAKVSVVNATHCSWFLVAAVGEEQGHHALCVFILPADLPNIEIKPKKFPLGRKAADIADVFFHNVSVPSTNRIGHGGLGSEILLSSGDRTHLLIASSAIGLARSAMEHSIRYSKERQTFGTPIANHQAVSFMIADMAKDIEAARLLTYQAAWLADNGQDNHREAEMAKTIACDTAMKVATDAVQVFGGYGYSREYPVEKLMRDAKIYQIAQGTTNEHRVNIARDLIGVS